LSNGNEKSEIAKKSLNINRISERRKVVSMSIKGNLSGVLAGAGLIAVLSGAAVHATQPKGASGLEAIAQESVASEQGDKNLGNFTDAWKHQFVVREIYSNGIVLDEVLVIESAAYDIHLRYFIREDTKGVPAEIATVTYATPKSDSNKRMHTFAQAGSVTPNGFSAGRLQTSFDGPMEAYNLVTLANTKNFIPDLATLGKSDLSNFLEDFARRYDPLKAKLSGLSPFPQEYGKYFTPAKN